jgi:hypothetical protein
MDARSEGWDLFERMLHLHHTAEDDLLWPVVRAVVDGKSDELALLDDMTAEHAALAPLLEEIDRTFANGESPAHVRADLDVRLREHLTHEETAALPLVDQTLTPSQWITFGQGAMQRFGPDMARFLPWLLDDADDEMTTAVLEFIPPPVQQSYRQAWKPAYDSRRQWATKRPVT